jgi:hypothetical protein
MLLYFQSSIYKTLFASVSAALGICRHSIVATAFVKVLPTHPPFFLLLLLFFALTFPFTHHQLINVFNCEVLNQYTVGFSNL